MKGYVTGSSWSYPNYEDWIGEEAEAVTEVVLYTCGDANSDDAVNSSDVVYLLNYLYREGYPPSPLEAGDVNLDSAVDGADVVYLINYLFKDGPPPCS